MAISEYERRRNELVLRRGEELRALLESSPSTDAAVNNIILRQAALSTVNAERSNRNRVPKPYRQSLEAQTGTLRQSERNATRSLLEER
jgi:hypothetical protein